MFADILPFDRSRLTNRNVLHPRSTSTLASHQRTHGVVRLRYERKDGESRPLRAFQVGAARVRMPKRTNGAPPEAILINTAGGLTGGDVMSFEVEVGEEAQLTVSAQACEKIYMAKDGESRITNRLLVEAGARLEWLPQPAIMFDRARFRRTTEIEMEADATLLALDGIVFGRTAMKETVSQGLVYDGWRIRRGGVLIYADTFRVDGPIESLLRRPSSMNGARACATMLYVAPDAEQRLEAIRELIPELDGIAGVSAWNRMLVSRVVAEDGYALHRDLIRLASAITGRPMPRVWMI